MNGVLFIDFNLVACDFLKFDWSKMLHGDANYGHIRSFIRRQTSGTSSGNEWQQVTTSGTASDNEWKRVTANDNK